MPLKPLKPCSTPGCCNLTRAVRCEQHAQEKPVDDRRKGLSERGYNYRWQKARATHLAHSPWCIACERDGHATPATDVDHIIPHRGDTGLFWDRSNWQSLCHECHSSKTAREKGNINYPPPQSRKNQKQSP